MKNFEVLTESQMAAINGGGRAGTFLTSVASGAVSGAGAGLMGGPFGVIGGAVIGANIGMVGGAFIALGK